MVIFGLVVGAIYWQINDSCESGLQNRWEQYSKLNIDYQHWACANSANLDQTVPITL